MFFKYAFLHDLTFDLKLTLGVKIKGCIHPHFLPRGMTY